LVRWSAGGSCRSHSGRRISEIRYSANDKQFRHQQPGGDVPACAVDVRRFLGVSVTYQSTCRVPAKADTRKDICRPDCERYLSQRCCHCRCHAGHRRFRKVGMTRSFSAIGAGTFRSTNTNGASLSAIKRAFLMRGRFPLPEPLVYASSCRQRSGNVSISSECRAPAPTSQR